MNRVITVAKSEFLTLIQSKAFIISIILMPVMMGGLFLFMQLAEDHIDVGTRRFAVIDHTGVLYDALVAEAGTHNRDTLEDGRRTGPEFIPSRADIAGRPVDDVKVELSDRVRDKSLFAFIEIPPDVITTTDEAPEVAYYAESTSYEPLPTWLRTTLRREITRHRFDAAGIDQALIDRLNTRAALTTYGLLTRAEDGSVGAAQEVDELARFIVPVFFLVLMFMAVMTVATQLINAIIEEKMSKISEVLLGSVTPFQLLMGKLVGVVTISLLLALVYIGGGLWAVLSIGRIELIDPVLLVWFLVFLVCAALMYGSLFLALGSACSDLKDAQSMLQPAMLLLVLAYLGSFIVIRNPDSTIAIVLSFFPTTTPFLMMLRMAMPPGPPLWHLVLSVVILIGSTTLVVWAGSRIFRVGILMQGKAPNLPELIKWIRA